MDRLEALGNSLSQISLYDIKSMYNQAKNVVLNVTEMEAKVREATNDEPWGASSTLMQDIAQGTFNFQHFNEIMPSIYARFMEKEARQWRQIYKALQLLEYLIKHGSERVVDDARSHISTLKMLRNFHYIDDRGKDEGVNVRNRSRELVELLSDVDKIRTERRKAKANKHKYVGTGNDGGLSFGSGRYGGFGSDTIHGGDWSGTSGGGSSSYGGGGSHDRDYGGGYSSGGGFKDDVRRGGFEEYNAGDDEVPVRRSSSLRNQNPARSTSAPIPSTGRQSSKAKENVPAPPAPEANLLDLLDDDIPGTNAGTLATNKALPAVNAISNDVDDEFADFQAAPVTQQTQNAKPANLMDMLNSTSSSHPAYNIQSAAQPLPAAMFGLGLSNKAPAAAQVAPAPGLFGAAPLNPAPLPVQRNTTMLSNTSAAKPSSNFDDLWSMSLGSGTGRPASAGGGKSIKDLEKEKASVGLWGKSGGGGGRTGAAFGSVGVPATGTGMMGTASSSLTQATDGADDLLL